VRPRCPESPEYSARYSSSAVLAYQQSLDAAQPRPASTPSLFVCELRARCFKSVLWKGPYSEVCAKVVM
jgi:hypothetical protein